MAQIKDLDLIKNTNFLYNSIVIYGAGNYGKLALNRLEQAGFSASYVCDSSVEKWGERLDGKVKIISPMELSDLRKRRTITTIIAINKVQYIKQVLKMMDYCGMEDMVCYTYFALNYVLSFQTSNAIFPQLQKEKKYLAFLHNKLFNESVGYWTVYNLMTDNAILVYQAAKVGSSSISYSLRKYGINSLHVHFLGGNWFEPLCMKEVNFQTERIQEEKQILRTLKNVKIITMVREPIGRDISYFFEALGHDLIVKEKYHVIDIMEAVNILLDDYSNFEKFGYQFEWFNHEIKEVFGVDIYEYEFDKERGYEIIRDKNVEILVIKMENLDQCEKIIGEFVGVTGFKIERKNSGSDKLYHFIYQEVKKQICIPQEIIDRYYKSNPAVDHFYTNEEKAAFLRRWKQNIIE